MRMMTCLTHPWLRSPGQPPCVLLIRLMLVVVCVLKGWQKLVFHDLLTGAGGPCSRDRWLARWLARD